ncbi:hypothetical protein Rs2_30508 [Raphanus sativus]|nr:hypothetical protein Rs2_30508 [Raphanus sativus]
MSHQRIYGVSASAHLNMATDYILQLLLIYLYWSARGHVKSSHFPLFQDITDDILSRIQWLESWSIEHVIPGRNIPSNALAQCVTYENRHHSYIALVGPAWLQSMLAQESRNA